MESVYLFSSGTLKRKANTICLESEAGRKYIPVENVMDIKVFGEVDLNKRFLEFLSQKRIPIHFFNREGYYVGTFYPREYLNSGFLILKQAEHYINQEKRMLIAREIVSRSIQNMIDFLKKRKVQADSLTRYKKKAEEASNVSELMGIEGNAREGYYSIMDNLVSDERFRIEKRTRRPPKNFANTLISFGNSLLYTTVLSLIYQTHLDPRIGYLHETNFRRFSLNLDIAELFKPAVVDRLFLNLVNTRQINERHFDEISEGLMLNDQGKSLFIKNYEQILRETVFHKKLNRYVSMRSLIKMELHKLEKHLIGEQVFGSEE
ncbi:MAG TPA: type I-B CRISPR-associated endonuclease Cas1 [Thermotoga sp.]|jgi:CRISPR-associated protein Cas1|uniref:type I-B CRISPR-associated endonuclease Cas1b n=1 Tax=Thermotoga sp. (strain RQ2) TaxID=126740 RepID=UPI000160171F|nr:type I-B CRISPR-associated endonuclease Cas1b [Thermotoga sp. RQ2]ACB09373.1 CRISPR-associated protein Cas1 [Thermotoga sp. RQ2]HBF70000.1 type I-B CRISPR-associated endonuclease Cas1 [Thermotoga sp.]